MPDRKLSGMDAVVTPVPATDSLVGFRSGAKGIRILLSDFLGWLNSTIAPAWANIAGKPSSFTPSSHTHASADLSDSTTPGRALLTAATEEAQRTALGLGNAATKDTGTGEGQVAAGNHGHTSLTMTSISLVCAEDSSVHTFQVVKEGSEYLLKEVE